MSSRTEATSSLEPVSTTVEALPVEVVFDTAKYPPPSGLKHRDITSRHLLFQTDELCLDLRVERDPTTSEAELVGQLADRNDPLKPLPDVPVYLRSEEKLLGNATSDRQGEFRLRYLPERFMSLFLPIREDRTIVVPVDRRMMERASGRARSSSLMY